MTGVLGAGRGSGIERTMESLVVPAGLWGWECQSRGEGTDIRHLCELLGAASTECAPPPGRRIAGWAPPGRRPPRYEPPLMIPAPTS